MSPKAIILVDGENILLRYQDSVKSDKKIPLGNVDHEQNRYVWHPDITGDLAQNILRVSYYTTFTGDTDKISDLNKKLASVQYTFKPGEDLVGKGTLTPYIYKKEKKSSTKAVDINLTVDALRHTFNKSVDEIHIVSGDGDFIPLIKEMMRQGIVVRVLAFENGCHPQLKFVPDSFYPLDAIFFKNT